MNYRWSHTSTSEQTDAQLLFIFERNCTHAEFTIEKIWHFWVVSNEQNPCSSKNKISYAGNLVCCDYNK